ncbi:MAG TPA: hypothetical protein VN634_16300 [Candidatus Limnocylindrales bacterium]|nr:hypothetical protein [Candidatus Limnocylindrales bacterium]
MRTLRNAGGPHIHFDALRSTWLGCGKTDEQKERGLRGGESANTVVALVRPTSLPPVAVDDPPTPPATPKESPETPPATILGDQSFGAWAQLGLAASTGGASYVFRYKHHDELAGWHNLDSASATLASGFHIVAATRDGLGARLYVDDVVSQPEFPFTQAIGMSCIGGGKVVADTPGDYEKAQNFFDGDICEIIVFNRALDATEMAFLRMYLRMSWGVP